MKKFEIDWGEIIVEIVKKKDLDCGDFSNCWEEDYDWSEFDLYVINNYFDDLIDWGEVYIKMNFMDMYKDIQNWSRKQIEKDLINYRNNIKVCEVVE